MKRSRLFGAGLAMMVLIVGAAVTFASRSMLVDGDLPRTSFTTALTISTGSTSMRTIGSRLGSKSVGRRKTSIATVSLGGTLRFNDHFSLRGGVQGLRVGYRVGLITAYGLAGGITEIEFIELCIFRNVDQHRARTTGFGNIKGFCHDFRNF